MYTYTSHHDTTRYINQQFNANVNENQSFRKAYDTLVVVVVNDISACNKFE